MDMCIKMERFQSVMEKKMEAFEATLENRKKQEKSVKQESWRILNINDWLSYSLPILERENGFFFIGFVVVYYATVNVFFFGQSKWANVYETYKKFIQWSIFIIWITFQQVTDFCRFKTQNGISKSVIIKMNQNEDILARQLK